MRQTKSKQITKAFRVDARAWANFEKAAKSYRATPAELLREFVGHTDAAMKGVESGRIRSFDGDVSQLLAGSGVGRGANPKGGGGWPRLPSMADVTGVRRNARP